MQGLETTGELTVFAERTVHQILEVIAHGVIAEGHIREVNSREELDHAPQDAVFLQLVQQLRELEGCPRLRACCRRRRRVR